MKELKHQPCKREYAELFKRRRIEKEGQKVYCYGILDMETDDVITECTGCDEWEMNAVDYGAERGQKNDKNSQNDIS